MGKTPFSNKCEILGRLWLFYSEEAQEHEGWRDFFEWANIGLPLAYVSWQGLASVMPDGEKIIDETWESFCKLISIDPMAEYADLNEAFESSPNAIIGS